MTQNIPSQPLESLTLPQQKLWRSLLNDYAECGESLDLVQIEYDDALALYNAGWLIVDRWNLNGSPARVIPAKCGKPKFRFRYWVAVDSATGRVIDETFSEFKLMTRKKAECAEGYSKDQYYVIQVGLTQLN